MNLPLANKTVVITGAGAGVGRGLAAGFCRDGADVVGFGRTAETLQQTAREVGQGRMHCVVGDVAQAADVERLFREAHERHGKVDILFNNAALYPRVPFLEASVDDWAHVMQVNVIGMARCCHAALPGMLERGYGRIVNLGSFAWKGPIMGASAYSVSKGAVYALTKAIAAEVDRARYPNVLVNELIPGVVKSRMSDDGLDPMEVYPHARNLVDQPAGGPHGELFEQSKLYVEYPSFATRLKRKLGLA